jgi:3-oxoacyl-[acyl-carrier-protein] synthase-3
VTLQRYTDVAINGIAHLDAPIRVTSQEIDAQLRPATDRLGLQPGMLEGLAGIAARRFWEPGTPPSEVAGEAAEKLLADSEVPREAIGALLNTSVCRDYAEPSTASIVHGRLGLAPHALNFDIGNACLGFVNGMDVAASMIERGQIDHALIVNAESSRYTIECTIERLLGPAADGQLFRESFATLTLGSGSVAMLLSRADLAGSSHRYRGGDSRAATQHADLCRGQMDDMRTQTRPLLMAGLELAQQLYPPTMAELGHERDDIAAWVVHQISKVHTSMIVDVLDLDADRVPVLYPEHGNIGPAGVPTILSKHAEAGALHEGDHAMLLGVGSGLNASVSEVVW